MKKKTWGFLTCLLILTFCQMQTICDAGEAKFPSKTITLVCAFPAGTSDDNFGRLLAPQIQKELGVPIEVVAKPGGSGITGTMEVLRSPRDGHTLLIQSPGNSVIPMAWDKDTPYRENDRTYLCRAVAFPMAIFVRADAPWKTLQDVKETVAKDPASFRWASCGITIGEVPMAIFRMGLIGAGIDLSKVKIVPFQGGVQAFTAMAGGHVDMYAGTLGVTSPFLSAGKIRALAVTSPERVETYFKGIPTTAEQGFPSIIAFHWLGFSGPPGLAIQMTQKWEETIKKIVNRPENKDLLAKIGSVPFYLSGEAFKKAVIQDVASLKASRIK
jgi:tripartite-type tricarboxylate transporter receptor subunit TctC